MRQIVTAYKPFIRYIVNAPHTIWWTKSAAPFLSKRNWNILKPSDFFYESSYGFNPLLTPEAQISDVEYCLKHAAIVIEYYGSPPNDSLFEPSSGRTIIDDLLAFTSIYFGGSCQYLWRETRKSVADWSSSLAFVTGGQGFRELAARPDRAIDHFDQALDIIPTIDETRLRLAMQWFFSAQREFEIERPLVEAALNWVCLESQANSLGKPGNNFQKVASLLVDQQFPAIPRLNDLYKLRNDGFHDGQLSRLSEVNAQATRTAGRALVRASILVLLGMKHTDFKAGFVKLYT